MGKSTISMVIFNSYVKLPSCQLISCRTVFFVVGEATRVAMAGTEALQEFHIEWGGDLRAAADINFWCWVRCRKREKTISLSWFLERFLDRNWGEQQQVAVRKNGVVLVDKPIRCPVYQYHPMISFPVLHGGGHVSLQVDVSRLAPAL